MCVVSMIGDHYTDKWGKRYPDTWPYPDPPYIPNRPEKEPLDFEKLQKLFPKPEGPTKAEFDQLRKEVLELKELLIKAKKYDAENGEPNCELETKIALIKKIAELVGVDLSDVFGNATP